LLDVNLSVYGIQGTHGPHNAYGEAPFTILGDYVRPNEITSHTSIGCLRRAAEKGFLVLLTPSYMGYQGGNQGWYQQMRANGFSRLHAYGRYLGMRYHQLPNIIWMHGGTITLRTCADASHH